VIIFLEFNHNIVGYSVICIVVFLIIFGLFCLLMDLIYTSEEQIKTVKIKNLKKITISDEYNGDNSIDENTHFNINEYFEENYIENT